MNWSSRKFTRRGAMALLGGSATAVFLAACSGESAPPTQAPAAAATSPPAAAEAPKPTAQSAATSAPATPTAAPKATAAPSGSAPASIQLMGADEKDKWLQDYLARFKKETNITVTVLPTPSGDDWANLIITQMASKTAADVIWGWGPYFAKFISVGGFAPLDSFIKRDLTKEQVDDFVPSAYTMWNVDGKQYGLPKYTGIFANYYNKDLFEKNNVDLPDGNWDWNKYREAATKLTKKTGDRPDLMGGELNFSLAFTLSTAIWSWGGEVHDAQDWSKCLLGEPKAIEALQYLADLEWKENVVANPVQGDAMHTVGWGAFASNKIGMRQDGSWAVQVWIDSVKDTFNWGVMPVPKGPDGKRETFLTTDSWGLYGNSKQPEAAWTLLKALVGTEVQRGWIVGGDWPLQPALQSLMPEWIKLMRERLVKINPKLEKAELEVFQEGFKYARPMVRFSDDPRAMEILQPVLDQIYKTGEAAKDVGAVIRPVAAKVTETLQKAKTSG